MRASETEPIQFDYNQNAFTVGAKVSQMRISVNSVKKTHAFRTGGGSCLRILRKKRRTFSEGMGGGAPFLRILRKRRTLPKGIICRFSEEFTKFQRKTHKFTKCSQKNAHFQKKGVIVVNSAKKTHVSQG